jgi:V/A-type H+-transporting ATPase subunit I
VVVLSGWVQCDRAGELKKALAAGVANPVVLVHAAASQGGTGQAPPSPLAIPALFRPGATLVGLFGTPASDELNPALVLAVTAPLFFGMMFGDLGQGLLLAGLALAGRRWLGRWIAPALACSLSSAVFGLLYGSVFGMEVEHGPLPLWLSPMKEPFRLLAISLWIGVGFLLLTFALKMVNLGLRGDWRAALLGFQGGAGALGYLGGVLWLRSVYQGVTPSALALLLVAAGLLLMGTHVAGELSEHGRHALGELLTEFFHGALSLLTNTLSFLRLGAFALNHAALSMALFLLADMIPRSPLGWGFRILLLVGGSALILIMDVLVVAVQTIRLEFYEGLTRYFRGDGREFLPLRFPETKTS